MAPFHIGSGAEFGPDACELDGAAVEFRSMAPSALGHAARAGEVDAGALSMVDYFDVAREFEPVGRYGIGVRTRAESVLLFSKQPIERLAGVCAVTDDTATSVRLLQTLVQERYRLKNVSYGRMATGVLRDGVADSVLLIGDEALRAARTGVEGFPHMADLGAEWFAWQGIPFAFARWAVRKSVPDGVKAELEKRLERSLAATFANIGALAERESNGRGFSKETVEWYWRTFDYPLTEAHEESVRRFEELYSCLNK